MTSFSVLPTTPFQTSCNPQATRLSRRIRRQIKRFRRLYSTSNLHRFFVLLFLVAFGFPLCVHFFKRLLLRSRSAFDDVADMLLVEAEDKEYLERLRNSTLLDVSDPLRDYNKTDVKISRVEWDYLYGEIVRKPIRPVLTKYKTRLLRELYKRTQYVLSSKYRLARSVSCNYANNVNDESSPHPFTCTPTSHRCPDGSFLPASLFSPREGTSVTWEHVVIVLLISKGRDDFLRAAIDTWISRLQEEATLFFVRDVGVSLPEELTKRPNTFIYDYTEETGMQTLDLKALIGWKEVHRFFAFKGKKYFLKVDDDTFLMGHNLIRFLNKMEYFSSGMEEALYFGHPFCGHGDLKALNYETWCYAGGGAYGLSYEALTIFLQQVKDGCAYFYDYILKAPNLLPEEDRYGGRYEDIMVGRCLRQARTRLQDRGTSLLACGSFFPYAPLHYYEAFGNSTEAMSKKLDGDPITIHNLEPSAIRFLDHLMYEYPLGGDVKPFSPENEHVQELIDHCHMNGKKMSCDTSTIF